MMDTDDDLLAAIEAIQADLDWMRRRLVAAPTYPQRKWLYTPAQAIWEKRRVELAYLSGRISFDAKRGLKAAITRMTAGWMPPSERDW